MFKNHLKIALRNMLKYKSFSFINIAGLGIGLACAILILLWVLNELSYDRFHQHADQLYRVAFTYRPQSINNYYQPGALAEHLKQKFPEFTHATYINEGEHKLTFNHHGFFERGLFADPDFFAMFSFPIIRGEAQSVFQAPNSIVITRRLAQKIFGNEEAMGKTLTLNDQTELRVTGIIEDIPPNTHFRFDFLIPSKLYESALKTWHAKTGFVYVMLAPESDYRNASRKISGVIDEINPQWENTLFLQPLVADHLYPIYGSRPVLYVYIFSTIAVIVLLIACINFMNLSTARAEKRHKEIGVRKVVGSSRWQLVIQFLAESLCYSFMALGLALLLVEILLPYVNTILDVQLQPQFSIRMAGGLILLTGVAGILSGSYPAFYLSSFTARQILQNMRQKSGKHASFRKLLVIVQFSLAILFIISVLTIKRQLDYVKNKDLGFNKEHVILLQTRGELQNKTQAVKSRLLQNDRVNNVTVSDNDFLNWTNSGPIQWEGMPADAMIELGYNGVDEDFLQTFHMQMAQGRFFSKSFATDKDEAFIINEAAVKAMGLADPVGREVTSWFGRKGRIVGVIKDYHTAALHQGLQPFALMPKESGNYLCIRIKPDRIPQTLDEIQAAVKEIVPDDPVQIKFLDETIDSVYKTDQRTQRLILFSTVLAVLVACLGLFGLAAFIAEQRTKEIGIRKVLGASVFGVLELLAKDFTKWILLANIIAWPLAWLAMNKWLQNFAYRVDLPVWPFVLAGFSALAIAMFTVSIQAVKAALANPVQSLRYE